MEGKGWTPAGELQVGDEIRSDDESTGEVEKIEIEQSTQEMYNLTVDEAHTFYVGHGQWLVHNTCDGPIVGGVKLPQDSLLSGEAAELQMIANKYNTQLDVIGSRAAGKGTNIGNVELPVGKGPGTRSDIDIRVNGQAVIDSSGALADAILEVGNGAGRVTSSTGIQSKPPVIIFRPWLPPLYIP